MQRSTVGLLAMVVLVGMGERMAERFLPIYLMALGGGALAIGLLQAMDNLLSALYSFPGGYLADRIGTKRSLLVFNLVAMAGFALVIVIPSWQAVLAGAVLFISWSAISLPATMSLMYKVLPQNKRTMGVTMHSLVRRIPMALGPLVGGIFIGVWGERDGVRLAFVAALVLAVVALVLQQRLIEDDRPDSEVLRRTPVNLSPEKNPLETAAADEPGHEKASGHRHPDPFLRTDPLRLRGGLVHEDHRRTGFGGSVRSSDHHRDGHGGAGLYPGGLPGGPEPPRNPLSSSPLSFSPSSPWCFSTAAPSNGWCWPLSCGASRSSASPPASP